MEQQVNTLESSHDQDQQHISRLEKEHQMTVTAALPDTPLLDLENALHGESLTSGGVCNEPPQPGLDGMEVDSDVDQKTVEDDCELVQ